jgi:HEPN domain-containing protein
MSKLRQVNGDDYPEAAEKHLLDAAVLQAASRPDGAAYHAGYVVECCLKTLLQAETRKRPPPIHGLRELNKFVNRLALSAGPRTARPCFQVARLMQSAAIHAWRPAMRYQAPSIGLGDSDRWLREARQVYAASVGALWQDGVI